MRSAPLVFGFVLIFAFLLLTAAFRSIVVAGKAVVLNLLSVGRRLRHPRDHLPVGLGREPPGLPLQRRHHALAPDVPVRDPVRALDGLPRVHPEPGARGLRPRALERAGVSLGIRQTAGVVTSAATVMVVTFAVFALIPIIDFKEMGIGLAAAVLIDATLIRAVLLPATMKLLGDRNWYLPRWLEWLPSLEHDETPRAPPCRSRCLHSPSSTDPHRPARGPATRRALSAWRGCGKPNPQTPGGRIPAGAGRRESSRCNSDPTQGDPDVTSEALEQHRGPDGPLERKPLEDRNLWVARVRDRGGRHRRRPRHEDPRSEEERQRRVRQSRPIAYDQFRHTPEESVLIQSKTLTTGDTAFKAAVADAARRFAAKPYVKSVDSPYAPGNEGQISRDRHSAIVTFKLRTNDLAKADKHVAALLATTRGARSRRTRPDDERGRRRVDRQADQRRLRQGPRRRPASSPCR